MDGIVTSGRLERRRVDAHRRADAGRQGGGRPGHRRDAQRDRLVRHARHARRPRHACSARSCAWSARRRAPRRPSSASPIASSTGSCRSSSCSRRSRSRSGWLLGPEPALTHRARRGHQRAHHRLPLRHGPGHADRGHGRHRPRRRAGHPHPRWRGARAGRPRRHASSSTRPARSPLGRPTVTAVTRRAGSTRGRGRRAWRPPSSAAPSIRSAAAIVAEAERRGLALDEATTPSSR